MAVVLLATTYSDTVDHRRPVDPGEGWRTGGVSGGGFDGFDNSASSGGNGSGVVGGAGGGVSAGTIGDSGGTGTGTNIGTGAAVRTDGVSVAAYASYTQSGFYADALPDTPVPTIMLLHYISSGGSTPTCCTCAWRRPHCRSCVVTSCNGARG